MTRSLFFCTLMCCAGSIPAHAQHQHHAPTKPAAEKPAPVVQKPIQTGYQTFNANEPLTDWRVANNTVRDIGGWRVYAREAAANAKPEAAK